MRMPGDESQFHSLLTIQMGTKNSSFSLLIEPNSKDVRHFARKIEKELENNNRMPLSQIAQGVSWSL